MRTLWQDLRFSLRLLAKDRSFTLTALLTLGIAIAANAAMFGIVRSVLLKPLPFPDSSRIVLLYNSYPAAGAPRVGAAVPNLYDRLAGVPALDIQALFRQEGVTYGDANGALRLTSFRATPSFYRLTSARPVLGRVFTDDDGQPGQEHKVLLSYGFWQKTFGGTRSVVGQSIRLNGTPYEVIGVLPADYTFLENDVDIYLPAAFTPDDRSDDRRHSNNWQMVGRLAPGATVSLVQQQVDALNRHLDEQFPEFHQVLKDAQYHTVAVPLQDDVVRDVKKVLYLLWGGVLFVLVIAAVNIANLVIVRASSRSVEMATRHALGADLGRLARQIVTETTVLSLTGGLLGLLAGWWTLRSVASLDLQGLPRGYEVGLDPGHRRRGARADAGRRPGPRRGARVAAAAHERERRAARGRPRRHERPARQPAPAGARDGADGHRAAAARRRGSAARELPRRDAPRPGLPARERRDGDGHAAGQRVSKDSDSAAFVQRALDGIRAVPGVQSAGATDMIPFGNNNNERHPRRGPRHAAGRIAARARERRGGARLLRDDGDQALRGRFFDARDTADATKTAIVDETLAARFWPDQDAVGRRLYFPTDVKNVTTVTPDTQFYLIVGVVKDVQMIDPRPDVKSVGAYYFPYDQATDHYVTFVVRTPGPSSTVQSDIRRVIAGIDPQLPVYQARTMQAWIDRALVGRRIPMLIAMAFGLVALLLAGVGIYGVLAYSVAQRRRELGLRMALGSSLGDVFRLVMFDAGRIIAIGLVLGLVGAFVVGRLMTNLLFGVTPLDPLVIAGMTLTLVGVALVASAIPAWRATTIDPVVVLGR